MEESLHLVAFLGGGLRLVKQVVWSLNLYLPSSCTGVQTSSTVSTTNNISMNKLCSKNTRRINFLDDANDYITSLCKPHYNSKNWHDRYTVPLIGISLSKKMKVLWLIYPSGSCRTGQCLSLCERPNIEKFASDNIIVGTKYLKIYI